MAEKEQKLKCIYCEQSFDEEAEYFFHRDRILCMCNLCGEISKGTTQIAQHFIKHLGDDLFKCLMCTETTNNFESMIQHITLHRKRRFKCKKCEAEFCSKFNLVDHIKKHFDHWKCENCKFTTKILKDLKEHKKSHEKEKPDRFYNVNEFMSTGLQLRDRFTDETIFISK